MSLHLSDYTDVVGGVADFLTASTGALPSSIFNETLVA